MPRSNIRSSARFIVLFSVDESIQHASRVGGHCTPWWSDDKSLHAVLIHLGWKTLALKGALVSLSGALNGPLVILKRFDVNTSVVFLRKL